MVRWRGGIKAGLDPSSAPLTTKANSPLRRPGSSTPRSKANCAGARPGLQRHHRRRQACAQASKVNGDDRLVVKPPAVRPGGRHGLHQARGLGGAASQHTASKGSPSTASARRQRARSAGRALSSARRALLFSQRTAGVGSSADKGTRGNSRSAAPGPPNKASAARAGTPARWPAMRRVQRSHAQRLDQSRARAVGQVRTNRPPCAWGLRKAASRQRNVAQAGQRSDSGHPRARAPRARTPARWAARQCAAPRPCGSVVRAGGARTSSRDPHPTVRISASVSR